MICIVGQRQAGKTTELIKMSAETGYPIVAPYFYQADAIERRARQLGLEIPKPIGLSDPDLLKVVISKRGQSGILVDEAGLMLKRLFMCDIAAVSINGSVVDLGCIR